MATATVTPNAPSTGALIVFNHGTDSKVVPHYRDLKDQILVVKQRFRRLMDVKIDCIKLSIDQSSQDCEFDAEAWKYIGQLAASANTDSGIRLPIVKVSVEEARNDHLILQRDLQNTNRNGNTNVNREQLAIIQTRPSATSRRIVHSPSPSPNPDPNPNPTGTRNTPTTTVRNSNSRSHSRSRSIPDRQAASHLTPQPPLRANPRRQVRFATPASHNGTSTHSHSDSDPLASRRNPKRGCMRQVDEDPESEEGDGSSVVKCKDVARSGTGTGTWADVNGARDMDWEGEGSEEKGDDGDNSSEPGGNDEGDSSYIASDINRNGRISDSEDESAESTFEHNGGRGQFTTVRSGKQNSIKCSNCREKPGAQCRKQKSSARSCFECRRDRQKCPFHPR